MELRVLLALAAAMAPALGSPIAAHNAPGDEILPFNPGGPMVTATEARMSVNPGGPVVTETTKPTPMSVSPGGPMIPASPPNSVPSAMPVNPGGPMIPVSSSSQGPPLSFHPGGPMIPASPPSSVPTPMSFNPGGPVIPAPLPSSKPTPMTVNPGEPIQTSGKTDPLTISLSSGAAKSLPQPSPASPPPPPPPPPPPFPFPYPKPTFITGYTIPAGGFIPSCKRMHHKTHLYPPLDPVEARATKQQLRDMAHGAPLATATSTTTVHPHLPTKASQGCTTTVSQSVPTPCEWHGTQTRYPSTTTKYRGVDCHGCSDVFVHQDIWFCPIQIINATQIASTPLTHWSTTCRSSTTLSPVVKTKPAEVQVPTITTPPSYDPVAAGLGPRQAPVYPPPPPDYYYDDLPDGCECPTTLFVRAPQTAGRTSTCYSRYTTATRQLNCDGCPLVVVTVLQGFGPVAHFTKTTTLALGTTTAYVCSAS